MAEAGTLPHPFELLGSVGELCVQDDEKRRGGGQPSIDSAGVTCGPAGDRAKYPFGGVEWVADDEQGAAVCVEHLRGAIFPQG